MTKEEAIRVLDNALYGGGNSFKMSEFRDAVKLALGILKETYVPKTAELGTHSIPSNLDEAAKVGWDAYYNSDKFPSNPCAQSGYKTGFKAGAEWMAGKFQKIEGCLVDWYSTSDGKEYCCGIKADEAFEIPEGFYIRKKQ